MLGGQEDLKALILKHGIKEIIISFKENGLEKKREIRNLCLGLGVEVEVRHMKLMLM